jgi:hypothetical protein
MVKDFLANTVAAVVFSLRYGSWRGHWEQQFGGWK